MTHAIVTAVSRSATHTMAKPNQPSIRLIAGFGVEGDAHAGELVKHLSRVKRDPTVPNIRQVHLMHAELHDELRPQGFDLAPGEMGENLTTLGIDILNLPTGTRLHIGETAVIEVTGLRNPCVKLETVRKGLMKACLEKRPDGTLIRKSGVMSVVVTDGEIRPGDRIVPVLPPEPHQPMGPV